jgi:aspartate/methionine/tyrosine aminotransferase
LVQFCRAAGIRLISDEIYHGITFGTPAATAVALDDQAIVVNSFSKYFSMTGWRLGWLVLPSALVQPVERLAQNFFISPPALSQHAAIAAFEAHDELQQNVRRYAANREILLNGLPEAGFDRLIATDGAFYVYADVSALAEDSVAFARRILTETGIAVTPGVDFDPARGHHFLRFSFAGATEDMIEAIQRLKSWRR